MAEATVNIESIAAGGDGVARHDNLVIFVPRTAPGDVARVSYIRKGNFARGELMELHSLSPERVEPSCAHYTADRCGGCQLQHISYEAQLRAKAEIVHATLKRIGRINTRSPVVRPSQRRWRYRRRLTLALRFDGKRWKAGLHPFDNPASIFELHDCPITMQSVLDVWREVLGAQRHFPSGTALRGSVSMMGDEAHFSVRGGRSWPHSGRFFGACTSLSSLWYQPDNRARQLVASRGANVRTGASFAQVNGEVAAEMLELLVRVVAAHAPTSVVDAYCGTGALAVQLGAIGARVTAIESDRDAVAGLEAMLPAGSRVLIDRVERVLHSALPADVAVLNPPRSGLHEDVPMILSSPGAVTKAIVYVSCDPATLARDITRLTGFTVERLECFDMFPQTAHVETLCVLSRRSAA